MIPINWEYFFGFSENQNGYRWYKSIVNGLRVEKCVTPRGTKYSVGHMDKAKVIHYSEAELLEAIAERKSATPTFFIPGDRVVSTGYLKSEKDMSVKAYPGQELIVVRKNKGMMVWVCAKSRGKYSCFYCPSNILKLKNEIK